MARKTKHSSQSSQPRAKKGGAKRSPGTKKKKAISPKRVATFKAYMGAKPQAKAPENLNRNPSANDGRRR